MSSKVNDEERVTHSRNDNIDLVINDKEDVIKVELF